MFNIPAIRHAVVLAAASDKDKQEACLVALSLLAQLSQLDDMSQFAVVSYAIKLFKDKALKESWLESVKNHAHLHSKGASDTPIVFIMPLLEGLKGDKALTCFALLMGEFMGLSMKQEKPTVTLSLSFLIQSLEALEKKGWLTQDKLRWIIERFKTAYRFETYRRKLETKADYKKGREVLKGLIIAALKKEKYLLLDGGYCSTDGGHTAPLKLTIVGDEVQGSFLNLGEGSEQHDTTGDDRVRVHALQLPSIPLSSLADSTFLDHLIDLGMMRVAAGTTAYNVDKNTYYSIKDVYDVLLTAWPEKAQPTQVSGGLSPQMHLLQALQTLFPESSRQLPKSDAPPHAFQHGESCTLKPFLAILKEELGQKEGETALLYMGNYAFELLLSEADFKEIDLNRVKDAARRWSRKAVKLSRKEQLEEAQKEEMIQTSNRVLEKIAQEESRRQQPPQQDHRLLSLDTVSYNFMLPECKFVKGLAVAEPSTALPPFSRNDFIDYLIKIRGLIDVAIRQNQWQEAKRIARTTLLALPNVSDPFWQEKRSGYEMAELTHLLAILQQEPVKERELLAFTPNTAMLFLKVLTISFAQATLSGLPEEIVQMYGAQTKRILNTVMRYYSMTHPHYLAIFKECQAFYQQYEGNGKPIVLTFDGVNYDLENIPFTSLTELRKDKELKFLNDLLSAHPLLFNTRFRNVVSKKNDEKNTLGLFAHRYSVNFGYSDHIAFEFPKPELDPLRHLTLLRELHYLFACSSYFSGNKKVTQFEYKKFGMEFKTQEFFHEKGTIRKAISLLQFEPKDLNNPSAGVFLDTFFDQSDDFKKLLVDLLEPSTTQNEQLLVQEGRTVDKLEISALELQQLHSIKTYDALVIPQLIVYFTHHFHRLKDPRFQAIFSHFLFSMTSDQSQLVLEQIGKGKSSVYRQMMRFFHTAAKKTAQLGWMQSQLFLLRNWTMSLRYLAESAPDSKVLKHACKKLKGHMEALLEKKAPHQEQILHGLISCIPYFDHPKMGLLRPIREKAIQRLSLVGCSFIASKERQRQEDFELGRSDCADAMPEKLPRHIVSHADYFLKKNYPAKCIGEGSYEFLDQNLHRYRVIHSGSSLHIYREIQGKWYAHKPQFAVHGLPWADHPLNPGILSQNVRIWHSLDEPKEALYYSLETDQLVCRLTERHVFHPTINDLRLAENYMRGKIAAYFSRIAPKQELLLWKDSKDEIMRVEMPKLNLVFELKNEKWHSSLHPNYYVDDQAYSFELEPYTHYLGLRNPQGQRIVILPNFGIGASRQKGVKKMALEYKRVQNSARLYTYSLTNKGKLRVPDQPEGILYLAYLALRKADYAAADKLIKQIKREKVLLNKESCVWISDLDVEQKESDGKLDRHPQACVLRMRLRLLMQELTGEKLADKQISGLSNDYFSYLSQRTQMFEVQLSQKEELNCISLIENSISGNKTKMAQLEIRRAILEGKSLPDSSRLQLRTHSWNRLISAFESVRMLPIIALNNVAFLKGRADQISFSWVNPTIAQSMRAYSRDPVPVAMPLRPGSALIDNFLYYYGIARHLEKAHTLVKELTELLRACRFVSDFKVRSCAWLLLNVLSNPNKFPEVEKLLDETTSLRDALIELESKHTKQEHDEWTFSYLKQEDNHHTIPTIRSFKPTPAKEKSPVILDKKQNPYPPLSAEWTSQGFLTLQKKEERDAEIQQDIAALDEMDAFFHSCQDENPCVMSEFKRLIDGIAEKKKRLQEKLTHSDQTYQLDLSISSLAALEKDLQDRHMNFEDKKKEKKEAIFAIAHSYPDQLILEKNGAMLKPLTLKEMIVYFGTDNDEAIYDSNPSLTSSDLKKLKELICDYLFTCTEDQKIERLFTKLRAAKKEFNAKGKEAQETRSAATSFVKEAIQERIYSPGEDNHLLVFDYFGKIRVRKEQIEELDNMVKSEEGYELEARTGLGKSSVLAPLWLYLKSCKNKASMMTVPASLFISQTKLLKRILGKAFNALILPIDFDRSQANNHNYVKQVHKKLISAQKPGKKGHKILLTTIQSLHAMTNLKLKEALGSGTAELQKELMELRQFISDHVSDFFDESKECFNIRQRFDYAVGAPKSIPIKQIKRACNLYREMFVASDLAEVFQFEFLPLSDKKKIPPLQENYEKELLPRLASLVVKKFGLPSEFEKIALEDLQGNYSEACETLYGHLGKTGLQEYEYIKKQLTLHLRRTLCKKCDDSYGFYPGTRFAIPFSDTTPKKRSTFSDVEDYVNFTIQANLKKPFEKKECASFIESLKLRALECGVQEVENSDPFALFKEIVNTPLMQMQDADYQKITDYLNAEGHLEEKLRFIEYAILPHLKYHPKKICSTPFNLVYAIDHIQAASGVVSPDTLPPRLKTKENKTAVIENLLALWKNSNTRFVSIPKGESTHQLKYLLENHKEETVLVDVAGLFRNQEIEQMAERILERRPEAKGVLHFDDEGNELVYEKEAKRIIPREDSLLTTQEFFIYIRKSKIIGTDVKDMPSTAKAIITVDRETQSDLFFQGAGRMRLLAEGQTGLFAMPEEDTELLFAQTEKRLFKHLVARVVKKSGAQKGEDVFDTLREYLGALIEESFWVDAKKQETIGDVKNTFHKLQQFLVKETQETQGTLRENKKKQPIKEAVAQLKRNILLPLERFLTTQPECKSIFDLNSIETRFNAFVDYEKLPKEMCVQSGSERICDVVADIIHDKEQLNEVVSEKEQENESILDKVSVLPHVSFEPAQPLAWDGDYVGLFKTQPAAHLLGIPIYYSPNFKRVSLQESENGKVQKPAYQFLVYQDKQEKLHMALLDLHDARAVFQRLDSLIHPSSLEDSYLLFSEKDCIAGDQINPKVARDNEALQAIWLINKLFTAHPVVTQVEKVFLNEHSGAAQFRTFAKDLQSVWPQLALFTTALS